MHTLCSLEYLSSYIVASNVKCGVISSLAVPVILVICVALTLCIPTGYQPGTNLVPTWSKCHPPHLGNQSHYIFFYSLTSSTALHGSEQNGSLSSVPIMGHFGVYTTEEVSFAFISLCVSMHANACRWFVCILITRNTHAHLCLAPVCRLCVHIIYAYACR